MSTGCRPFCLGLCHWGRVMHICVSKLNIIGSDNGLSSGRRHTIIWTNAGLLLIWPLGTNFSEMLIHFRSRKCIWKYRLRNGAHFVSAPECVKCVSTGPWFPDICTSPFFSLSPVSHKIETLSDLSQYHIGDLLTIENKAHAPMGSTDKVTTVLS